MPTVRYTVANGQIIAEKRTVRRFYQTDALGSVIGLFDSNQTKTDAATYWPYGGTRTSSGTFGSKMGFVGSWGCRKQIDGDIYMRARVQEPKDGRWLTVDPLWPYEAPYGYSEGRPTCIIDPSGMQARKRDQPRTYRPPNDYCGRLRDRISDYCWECRENGFEKECMAKCDFFVKFYLRQCGANRTRPTNCEMMLRRWDDRFDFDTNVKIWWVAFCHDCCAEIWQEPFPPLFPPVITTEALESCMCACWEGNFGYGGLPIRTIIGAVRGLL